MDEQQLDAAYQEFLRLTQAMTEALARKDAEGFGRLVDARGALVAQIGDNPPVSTEAKRCLYEAAKLEAGLQPLVEELWKGIVDDIQQLATGRKAATAYYRSMSRRDPADNSKFIDRTK